MKILGYLSSMGRTFRFSDKAGSCVLNLLLDHKGESYSYRDEMSQNYESIIVDWFGGLEISL